MPAQANKINFVVAGLMLGILMSSMDNTIVATSMGTIVSDLGGLGQFVWVTSAYMVTTMAGTPVFGKLSDMYGRKRFFVFGLLLFLIGSILCGLSSSIAQLSMFRAIQGIGGGAIMPIALTILFDLFPQEQRGKISGITGAVFGASSIFGPLLGAVISDHLGWHWIFYVNVPIGAVSCLLIVLFYRESVAHSRQKIDWWGAATLIGSIVCLMFALELGGGEYAWNSGAMIGLFLLFAILFAGFVFAETKAEAPIVSFRMFGNRLYAASNAAAFFYGSGFVIATVYIPIFIQGVFGGSATNSGMILMPMLIAGVVFSQIGGRLTAKTSYRNIMIGSAVLFSAGMFSFSTLSPASSRFLTTMFMIVTGMGVGMSMSVLTQSAIHHFEMRQRGAATSSVVFLRSLGMTIGITVFGIVQRNSFAGKLAEAFGTAAGIPDGAALDPRSALTPEKRVQIPPQALDKIVDALASSIAHTFLWALVPAALATVSVLLMSGDRASAATRKASKMEITSAENQSS
ncbi:major facilitator transporter [Gordoniibacillus kamchatkensis]|uniref:Major facilitator transporter n=1 Tax=Gordoniibacillus kamchatkensis TaxID=1590651 RepID=A0ABR5ADN3_9BACL|nr:MDR family MFS transporter [Paenibacillus sp. VKM B-2647]KIL39065.1 major facilitator transporter [Paenibacillus sp. VKM B-2647]